MDCGLRLGGLFLLVRAVQHFDQAVLKLKALIEQSAQHLDLFCQLVAVRAMGLAVTMIVERQGGFGNHVDTRVNGLGQGKPALIIERFRFLVELLINFEVACRNVINQQLAELNLKIGK